MPIEKSAQLEGLRKFWDGVEPDDQQVLMHALLGGAGGAALLGGRRYFSKDERGKRRKGVVRQALLGALLGSVGAASIPLFMQAIETQENRRRRMEGERAIADGAEVPEGGPVDRVIESVFGRPDTNSGVSLGSEKLEDAKNWSGRNLVPIAGAGASSAVSLGLLNKAIPKVDVSLDERFLDSFDPNDLQKTRKIWENYIAQDPQRNALSLRRINRAIKQDTAQAARDTAQAARDTARRSQAATSAQRPASWKPLPPSSERTLQDTSQLPERTRRFERGAPAASKEYTFSQIAPQHKRWKRVANKARTTNNVVTSLGLGLLGYRATDYMSNRLWPAR